VIATVGSWPSNQASVVGKAICVPPEAAGSLLNQNAVRLRGNRNLDQRFLFYLLRSDAFQTYIVGTAQGSANQASITLKDIFGFEFPLPPLPYQRAIGTILGLLDDKIELNRRTNETLEEMARAMFRSWFVHFTPTDAKEKGRDVGFPQHFSDLFPDSFEDSSMGRIPKGWTISTLGELFEHRIERCTPSADTVAVPYVPIDCISSKSLFLTESRHGSEAQSSLTRFYKHDILFGAMRPYFHKVCIAPFDGTTRTTVFVLRAKDPADFSYSTLLLHDPGTVEYATRHSTGSTIPYAKWDRSLALMPIVLPPPAVRGMFNKLARPLLDRIPERYFETKDLKECRDALLPRLVSGELRFANADRIVGGQV